MCLQSTQSIWPSKGSASLLLWSSLSDKFLSIRSLSASSTSSGWTSYRHWSQPIHPTGSWIKTRFENGKQLVWCSKCDQHTHQNTFGYGSNFLFPSCFDLWVKQIIKMRYSNFQYKIQACYSQIDSLLYCSPDILLPLINWLLLQLRPWDPNFDIVIQTTGG